MSFLCSIGGAFRDIVTGKDGATHDIGRWSWLVSTASVIGGGAWNAIHGGVVDLMALAQALGLVVTAHGVALFAKKDTEPVPPKDQP